MPKEKTVSTDIECLNNLILRIDMDDLEIETLDQRIELSLAVLFGETGIESLGDDSPSESSCGTFTCNPYIPPF